MKKCVVKFPCRSFTFILPLVGFACVWCAGVRGGGGCGCNPRGRDGTRLGRREEANVRVEGTGQDWEDEKELKNREEGTSKDWEDEKELKNRVEGTWYPPFFLFLL